MLAFIRTNRLLQSLVATLLLGGWLFTFCQTCLAHATEIDQVTPVSGATHCETGKDSAPVIPFSDHVEHQCIGSCDCDSLSSSVNTLPKTLTSSSSKSFSDPVFFALNHSRPNHEQVAFTIPLPEPPERSCIASLERSCVQLK
jgi:hypothetical protein